MVDFVDFWSGKKKSKGFLSSIGSKLFSGRSERRRIEEILGELSLILEEVEKEFSAVLEAMEGRSEELMGLARVMGAPAPSIELEDPESILEEAERLLMRRPMRTVELEVTR